jgi:hypothetical protein
VSGNDATLEAKGFNYDILENRQVDELIVKSGKPAVYAAGDSPV